MQISKIAVGNKMKSKISQMRSETVFVKKSCLPAAARKKRKMKTLKK